MPNLQHAAPASWELCRQADGIYGRSLALRGSCLLQPRVGTAHLTCEQTIVRIIISHTAVMARRYTNLRAGGNFSLVPMAVMAVPPASLLQQGTYLHS